MIKNINVFHQRALLSTSKLINFGSQQREKSFYRGKKVSGIKEDEVVYEYQNVPDPKSTDFEEGEFLPRKLTYIPPKMPQFRGKKPKPWINRISPITIDFPEYVHKSQEYSETAQYPDVFDLNKPVYAAGSKKIRYDWYQVIRNQPSIDQKMIEIVEKICHPCINLDQSSFRYGHLPMIQHVTRCVLVKGSLPGLYSDLQVNEEDVVQIREMILDAIKYNYEYKRDLVDYSFRHKPQSYPEIGLIVQRNLVAEINSICQQVLTKKAEHLLQGQVDNEAFICSWWWKGNLWRHSNLARYTSQNIEYIDQAFQYKGVHDVSMRMSKPLPQFISPDDNELRETEITEFTYSPAKLGYNKHWSYLTNVPGFWNDMKFSTEKEYKDFPYLTIQNRYLYDKKKAQFKITEDEENDHLSHLAIMQNFAITNSLSMYHGFTPYDELSYPFMNQNIQTDGQNWFFSAFQLNSHSLHGDLLLEDVTRKNICWATGNMKLYESYEDGKFHNINDDVIRNLIKFFTLKPQLDENVEYRPYLKPELDTRSEEQMAENRITLKERYCNWHEKQKHYIIRSRRVIPAEWLFRVKDAPTTVQWRRKYDFIHWPDEQNKKYFNW